MTDRPPNTRRADAWQRRESLVTLILGGSTVGEAAALVGVARTTASGWLGEPDVKDLLRRERAALADATREAMMALHREAVGLVLAGLRKSRDFDDGLSVLRITNSGMVRGAVEADRPERTAVISEIDAEIEELLAMLPRPDAG